MCSGGPPPDHTGSQLPTMTILGVGRDIDKPRRPALGCRPPQAQHMPPCSLAWAWSQGLSQTTRAQTFGVPRVWSGGLPQTTRATDQPRRLCEAGIGKLKNATYSLARMWSERLPQTTRAHNVPPCGVSRVRSGGLPKTTRGVGRARDQPQRPAKGQSGKCVVWRAPPQLPTLTTRGVTQPRAAGRSREQR